MCIYVYVCMYHCMYVCMHWLRNFNLKKKELSQGYEIDFLGVCMHVYLCVCVCVCLNVCMYVCFH